MEMVQAALREVDLSPSRRRRSPSRSPVRFGTAPRRSTPEGARIDGYVDLVSLADRICFDSSADPWTRSVDVVISSLGIRIVVTSRLIYPCFPPFARRSDPAACCDVRVLARTLRRASRNLLALWSPTPLINFGFSSVRTDVLDVLVPVELTQRRVCALFFFTFPTVSSPQRAQGSIRLTVDLIWSVIILLRCGLGM